MTRLWIPAAFGLWASIYTGSVAVALWKQKNRSGAVLAAILAASALCVPPAVEVYLIMSP